MTIDELKALGLVFSEPFLVGAATAYHISVPRSLVLPDPSSPYTGKNSPTSRRC